jgi:copper transport protein
MQPARPRGTVRFLAMLLLVSATVLMVSLATTVPALAHAALVRAEPSDGAVLALAPAEVRLTFTEPVSAIGPGLRVLRADGTRVDGGTLRGHDGSAAGQTSRDLAVRLPSDLPDGGYVATWRVRSVDGHAVAGALRFTIGDAGAVPDEVVAALADMDVSTSVRWLDRVARGLLMVALVAAAGAATAAAMVARTDTDVRLATRLARGAALGALTMLPVATVLQATVQAGAWPVGQLWLLLPDLPDGSVPRLVAQAIGLAVLVVLPGRIVMGQVHTGSLRTECGEPDESDDRLDDGESDSDGDGADRADRADATVAEAAHATVGVRIGLVAAAALTLLPLAAEGHQRSAGGLVPLLDAVHLGAAAAWTGAVLLLAAAVRTGTRTPDSVSTLARRVGRTAGVSLVTVSIAGVAQATFLLEGAGSLGSTTYGRTLSLKVGLVALAVVLATVARRRAHRSTRGWARARRLLAVEVLLLGVVALVTGALVTIAPPAGQEPSMFTTSAPLGDGLTLDVGVDALQPDRLELHLYVLEGGALTERPLDVVARFTSIPDGIGPFVVEPALVEPGHWFAALAPLPAGDWSLEVTVGLDRFTARATTLTVPIPQAAR